MPFEISRNLRLILPFFGMGIFLGFLSQIKIMGDVELQRKEEWSKIRVAFPTTPPKISQDSIDLAIRIFNIKIPDTAAYPRLNLKLNDRGTASRRFAHQQIKVEIGPSAFHSWSLLGSTLAHELEVHCQQNWTVINLMDVVGLNGSMWAERQAYLYEINQAKRFGLDTREIDLVEATMAYFYDVDSRDSTSIRRKIGARVGRWLARSIYLQ